MPFLDLIGHERPTKILKASIRHDRVAHSYLFFGEDGIGKRLAALIRVRDAARRVGALRNFPAGIAGGVLDDHTPFLQQGVPSIDLIDFDFPCWHRTCDDITAVSSRSVDAVGETVLLMLSRL